MKIILTITLYVAMALYAASSDASTKALAPKAPSPEHAQGFLENLAGIEDLGRNTYELDPSEMCQLNLKYYLNSKDLLKFKASCKALGLESK